MKVYATLTLVMISLLAGCERDSGTGAGDDDSLSVIKQANAVLIGVRDAQAAQAAKSKLKELTGRLQSAAATAKKAGKNGPPANEDDRTTAAAQELTGNAARVKTDPATGPVIGAELDAFMKVMTGQG